MTAELKVHGARWIVACAFGTAVAFLLVACNSASSTSTTAASSTTAPPPTAAPPTFATKPPATAAAPVTSTTACGLQVTFNYIVRYVDPGQPPSAAEIGNVDYQTCSDTLSNFQRVYGNTPGECAQLAKESDNPGYDVTAASAPPLKDVILEAGDGC